MAKAKRGHKCAFQVFDSRIRDTKQLRKPGTQSWVETTICVPSVVPVSGSCRANMIGQSNVKGVAVGQFRDPTCCQLLDVFIR
jgi:hypothetical protein